MKNSLVLLAALATLPAMAHADTFPFGSASAYNIVALGTTNSRGTTLVSGNIGTSADIAGRMAAANYITTGTSVGGSLNADAYGSSTNYAMVAGSGLGAGTTFTIDGGGNAFAPGTNGSVSFTNGGTLTSTGTSPINWATTRSQIQADAKAYAGMTINGQVLGTGTSYGANFNVLQGTNSSTNVFRITASALSDSRHPIDIVVPAGSLVVINVIGSSATLNAPVYINGVLYTGNSTAGSNILFNFPTATTVAINASLQASVLAPYALLTSTAPMGGQFIAAAIGQTAAVYNIEFGSTPGTASVTTKATPAVVAVAPTPEPGSLVLLGTGVLAMAALIRRRPLAATAA